MSHLCKSQRALLLVLLALGGALLYFDAAPKPAAVTAVAGALPEPTPPKEIRTVEDLWVGFNPRALPLEVEVVKSWDEGDLHFESLYFTGEIFEGEKVRVFAYLGRPKRSPRKIPGLLHVHGGGQTAILDWPRFWAKRGYACLSFDFCGNTNTPELGPGYRREHYTRWGKAPADMMKVSGGLSMKPTPRHNPWYHWMLAARRGLTLLESLPQVDADKLGVFGISVGGTLTWGIAAVDKRVKAAAPIYGCGWEYYQYPPDTAAPMDDDIRLWRTFIAPEALASRITCPIFLLSATNDGHGRMDLAYRTLDRVPSVVKGQVFTPNSDHHVEPAEAESLPRFMDSILMRREGWPETPKVEITVVDGVPTARVRAPVWPDFVLQKFSIDVVEQVAYADVFYCLNNDWPTTRFWRKVHGVRQKGNLFDAPMPFLKQTDVLYVFANVFYQDGTCVSSLLEKRSVIELVRPRPTVKRQMLIDAMETPTDWNWVPAYTDPCRSDRFFAPWIGPAGEKGFTLDPTTFGVGGAMTFYFGTRKIGDPQFNGIGRKTLFIDVPAGNVPVTLTVRLQNRVPTLNQREFTAELPAPTGEGVWRTYRMEAGQFKNSTGEKLPSWDHVEFFVLNGTTAAGKPPVFKRLRWAE